MNSGPTLQSRSPRASSVRRPGRSCQPTRRRRRFLVVSRAHRYRRCKRALRVTPRRTRRPILGQSMAISARELKPRFEPTNQIVALWLMVSSAIGPGGFRPAPQARHWPRSLALQPHNRASQDRAGTAAPNRLIARPQPTVRLWARHQTSCYSAAAASGERCSGIDQLPFRWASRPARR